MNDWHCLYCIWSKSMLDPVDLGLVGVLMCELVGRHICFRGLYCLNLQPWRYVLKWSPHSITTHKVNIDIFTAMRTSYVILYVLYLCYNFFFLNYRWTGSSYACKIALWRSGWCSSTECLIPIRCNKTQNATCHDESRDKKVWVRICRIWLLISVGMRKEFL